MAGDAVIDASLGARAHYLTFTSRPGSLSKFNQAREFIDEEKRRMAMDSRFDSWSKAEVNIESRRRFEAAQVLIFLRRLARD